MFSVHQMHPETALRLSLGAALGGLAKQERSLQNMITKHGTGLVVMGTSIDYMRELTFFSAPFVVTETTVGRRDDGKLLVFRAQHSAGGGEAVAVQIRLRPVKLSGGPALDALPAPVNHDVGALFDSDEIVPRSALPTRYLEAEARRWTAGAEKIGEGGRPFFIGRDDCEFAEQWFFARLPSIVATAREQLLLDGADYLSASAGRPLSAFHGEFFRPMFFGDRGKIETEAYRKGDQTVAVHRVRGAPVPGSEGADGNRPLCALAVEIF
jgi:acyl-CoA thioesterase FadM